MADWMDTLAAVAPGIATALGGPVAGIAVRSLEQVFGLTSSTPDQLAQAVNGATPDQLLELKKADQAFMVQMKQLDIDLEKVSADDRNSARQRESTVKDKTPAVLGIGSVIGFFGLLGYMLVYGLKKDVGGSDAFLLLLGTLGTVVVQVYAYYFGSSSSSRSKDETIKAMTK